MEFPLKMLVGARVCTGYSDLLVSGNALWVSLLSTVIGCFPSNTFSVVYYKFFFFFFGVGIYPSVSLHGSRIESCVLTLSF